MTNPFAIALGTAGEQKPVEPPVTFDQKYAEGDAHENVTDELFTVRFNPPAGRSFRRLTNPEGEAYTQVGFATAMGKYVNCFVYFDEAVVQPGNTLVADVQIRKKTTATGREFLYAELRPTQKQASHTLTVFGKKKFAAVEETAQTFRAFGDIPGGIVLFPVDP